MRARLGCGLLLAGLLAGGPAHAQKFSKPDPELIALVQQAETDTKEFADKYDEQVWLTDMSLRLADIVPDPDERIKLLKMIHSEASRAQVPPQLVLALIQVESKFDPYAVSRAGAVGLMQIMPFWLKLIGRPDDSLVHVRTNLRMGCTILRYYLDKEHNNYKRALARYNGSYGRADYSYLVLHLLNQRWSPS